MDINMMKSGTIEIEEMEEEMSRGRTEIRILECERCKHKWVPRMKKPAVCPNCHSPYWNKPLPKKEKAKG